MNTFSDADLVVKPAFLLVGSPGSGKSTLAYQFPRPYVFDLDGNMKGPMTFLKEGSPTKSFPTVKYDSVYVRPGVVESQGPQKVGPFDRWRWMVECFAKAVKDETIDTIIFDSTTVMGDVIKADILRQRANNPSVKNAPTPTESTLAMTPLVLQEWDTFAFYWRELLLSARACGKTVIFIAHKEWLTDDEGKAIRECLAIQGQTRTKFAALFTDVLECYIESKGLGSSATYERMIRTVPSGPMDDKGNKTSMMLPPTFPAKDALKLITPHL